MLPISHDLIERVECAELLGENVRSDLVLDVGLRLGVVHQQGVVSCGLKVVDAGLAAAVDI